MTELASLRTFSIRAAKVVACAFAAVGFFDIVGRGVLIPLTGTLYGNALSLPHDIDVQRVVASPDNSMKAINYVWTGPAFDAGCYQMVVVVNEQVSTNTAWQQSNLVYQADCNTFPQLSWEPPANGRVHPRLRIDADAGKADFMSRLAMGGRVAVAYRGDL